MRRRRDFFKERVGISGRLSAAFRTVNCVQGEDIFHQGKRAAGGRRGVAATGRVDLNSAIVREASSSPWGASSSCICRNRPLACSLAPLHCFGSGHCSSCRRMSPWGTATATTPLMEAEQPWAFEILEVFLTFPFRARHLPGRVDRRPGLKFL